MSIRFIQPLQRLLISESVQFEMVVERLPQSLPAEMSCAVQGLEIFVGAFFEFQMVSHRVDRF
ncbi:hypothetical protein [Pseudomonas sp. ANT_J12]|uniref:hypothetical protein n=1 Tax=Pseudomonas sp. ANT_J12 TaxID=2597351 RepID=UPI0015B48E34|nr:hypothetical protein [Pseudomonas sp. ANT_J12]